jgi:hypothetical protein
MLGFPGNHMPKVARLMRRVGMCSAIEQEMSKESEHNPAPEQAAGAQPLADPQAELRRQIRRALLLGGDLSLEEDRRGGFDPYNNRAVPASGVWRLRRRD